VWRAVDSPPFIYWTAITLAQTTSPSDVEDAHGTVCDSWSLLELGPLGFESIDLDGSEQRAHEPWLQRSPRQLAA